MVSDPLSSASGQYTSFRETRFFGSLDGLRALSIIGVIWTHTWFGTPQFDRLEQIPLLRGGRLGVEVFFTISGFLITTLLLREASSRGSISLRNFYIRRSLRIWPIYYFVLALYVALVMILERGTERGRVFFHYLPGYLTYTYTWFAGWGTAGAIFNFAWSLSTEEQFYFFWPVILKMFRGVWPLVIIIAVMSISAAAGFGALDHVLPETSLIARMLRSVSVPICVGSILAIALHHPGTFNSLYRVLGRRAFAPFALLVFVLCIWPNKINFVPLWFALPLLIGSCVIREDNGLAGLLRLKPVAYIGVLSYGMYLYNTLVVKMMRPALSHVGLRHPLAAFPFIFAVTVLVAWLSYRYLESPFLRLKDRFSRLTPPPSKSAPTKIESAQTHGPTHP